MLRQAVRRAGILDPRRQIEPRPRRQRQWVGGRREQPLSGLVDHYAQVALHLVGCVLVFLLVARILAIARPRAGAEDPKNRWIALAVALVYAVHPLSGFPVNYILARDLLLMQAFALGALLVHASHAGPRPSPWRWAVALALFDPEVLPFDPDTPDYVPGTDGWEEEHSPSIFAAGVAALKQGLKSR